MTEPKEEKCEACCGSGYINFWTDDGHISMRTCRRCDGYGYIKAKPMTNEEYLKSLDTEQLAEAIYYLTWFHTELDERLDKNVKNGCYNDDENIKIVTEWLKQPNVFE